jgi:hypothetical protein
MLSSFSRDIIPSIQTTQTTFYLASINIQVKKTVSKVKFPLLSNQTTKKKKREGFAKQ